MTAENESEQILGEILRGEESSRTLTQRRSLMELPPMELPVEKRRQVLSKQAEEIKGHYEKTRDERVEEQGGRIYDYGGEEKSGE